MQWAGVWSLVRNGMAKLKKINSWKSVTKGKLAPSDKSPLRPFTLQSWDLKLVTAPLQTHHVTGLQQLTCNSEIQTGLKMEAWLTSVQQPLDGKAYLSHGAWASLALLHFVSVLITGCCPTSQAVFCHTHRLTFLKSSSSKSGKPNWFRGLRRYGPSRCGHSQGDWAWVPWPLKATRENSTPKFKTSFKQHLNFA